ACLCVSSVIFVLWLRVVLRAFHGYADLRVLHAFPTRRSSDLILLRAGCDCGESTFGGGKVVSRRVNRSGTTAQHLNPESRRPSGDRKSTRLNSSHVKISYAVFCLKKKISRQRSELLEK